MGRKSNDKWDHRRADRYIDARFDEKDRLVALFAKARHFWRALGGR